MLNALFLPFRIPVALALTPVAWLLLYQLCQRPQTQSWVAKHRSGIRRWMLVIAVASVLFFLGLDVGTLRFERPFSHDEPALLANAAAYLHGQPMYPAANAPLDYGILYGPATFLLQIPPMLLGAVRFFWFQMWATAVLIAALFLAGLTFLRQGSRFLALCALAYVCAVWAFTITYAWEPRGDVWALCFLAGALYAAVRARPPVADLILVVCGAFMIDLKAVLLLPALLPFVWLWGRDGRAWWRRLLPLLGLPAASLLPFAMPGIAAVDYRYQLQLAARHGFSRHQLVANLLASLLHFIVPVVVSAWAARQADVDAWKSWLRKRRPFLLLLGLCTIVLITSGAKNGAGPWHLMPLALGYAMLCIELWSMSTLNVSLRILSPALWVAFMLVVREEVNLFRTIQIRVHEAPGFTPVDYAALQRDLLQIVAQHPDRRIQMGYGDDLRYNFTWMRQALVLEKQPLLLDANTQYEHLASGEGYSTAFLQAIVDCRSDVWLIPRGSVPFSMRFFYAGDQEKTTTTRAPALFPAPLPRLFMANYVRLPAPSAYFDLWACRPKS